jgi:hypothetical protein
VYSQLGIALYGEGGEMRLLASCVSSLSGQDCPCEEESSPSPSILREQPVSLHCPALQLACVCILARRLSSAQVFWISCPRKLLRPATVPSSRSSRRCMRARRASCPVVLSCIHASQLSETSEDVRSEGSTNRCLVHLDGQERPPATSHGSRRAALASCSQEGKIRLGSTRR